MPNSDASFLAISSAERPSLSCCQMMDPVGLRVTIWPPLMFMSTAPSKVIVVRTCSEILMGDSCPKTSSADEAFRLVQLRKHTPTPGLVSLQFHLSFLI